MRVLALAAVLSAGAAACLAGPPPPGDPPPPILIPWVLIHSNGGTGAQEILVWSWYSTSGYGQESTLVGQLNLDKDVIGANPQEPPADWSSPVNPLGVTTNRNIKPHSVFVEAGHTHQIRIKRTPTNHDELHSRIVGVTGGPVPLPIFEFAQRFAVSAIQSGAWQWRVISSDPGPEAFWADIP